MAEIEKPEGSKSLPFTTPSVITTGVAPLDPNLKNYYNPVQWPKFSYMVTGRIALLEGSREDGTS